MPSQTFFIPAGQSVLRNAQFTTEGISNVNPNPLEATISKSLLQEFGLFSMILKLEPFFLKHYLD